MTIPPEWLYPASIQAASQVQQLLAARILIEDHLQTPHTIAGMDVSNNLKTPDLIYAAAVNLDWPSLTMQERAFINQEQKFPYIPGFLGFREAPALVEAFRQLQSPPQLIFVDGHGISHPRRLGVASHIGVLLDVPTIGVAKSILVGHPASPLGSLPGDQVPLMWKDKQIATVLRTKLRCNPLIISVGHKITLETAVQYVLQGLKGYRLPEPTRQAHLAANVARLQKIN